MSVKEGDTVKVEYEGRFEDGQVFDSSTRDGKSNPIEFKVGAHMVIPGFEEAVIGMSQNEEKEVTIEPEKAYGKPNPELKKDVPKSALPQDQEPKVGMTLVMTAQNGQQIPAKVVEVHDNKIVIDLNHPLAGKKLIFKIKIIEVSN